MCHGLFNKQPYTTMTIQQMLKFLRSFGYTHWKASALSAASHS